MWNIYLIFLLNVHVETIAGYGWNTVRFNTLCVTDSVSSTQLWFVPNDACRNTEHIHLRSSFQMEEMF